MHRHDHGTLFERDSHVLDYWLAHCEGFAIARNGVRARVAGVVVDPRDGRARSMLVRSAPGGRTRVVDAAAVVAVDPFQKVLYLERRGSGTARAAGRAGRASAVRAAAVRGAVGPRAAVGAARALALLRLWVAVAARLGVRAYVWSAPRVRSHGREVLVAAAVVSRRAVLGGARGGRAAAAWCRPRAVACGRASAAAGRELASRGRGHVRRRRTPSSNEAGELQH